MNIDKNIEFVAKHYRKGQFSVERGWKRLGIRRSWGWRRLSAAIAVGVIVVSATAYVAYQTYVTDNVTQQQTVAPGATEQPYAVKAMDFENAPLLNVVDTIEAVYGVKVYNVPENAYDYHLSLHYEGNAYELIESINDILDINLAIE